MTVYALYHTDNWHTPESRELKGLFTDYKKMVAAVSTIANSDDVSLSDHDKYLLETIQQTQGYEGIGEFLYDKIETNTII